MEMKVLLRPEMKVLLRPPSQMEQMVARQAMKVCSCMVVYGVLLPR
jgi:hypothetical protein